MSPYFHLYWYINLTFQVREIVNRHWPITESIKNPNMAYMIFFVFVLFVQKTQELIRHSLTCHTQTRSKPQYTGETEHPFNERLNGQRDDLKHRIFKTYPVTEHLWFYRTWILMPPCCIHVDHNPKWADQTRKASEIYRVGRLNIMQPHGINKWDQRRLSYVDLIFMIWQIINSRRSQ